MERTSNLYDAAIVGGGDVGLAMALALAQAADGGLRLALLGGAAAAKTAAKSALTMDDPRAFALSAGSRHLLESLGVWAALEPAVQAVVRIEITDTALSAPIRPVLLGYDNEVDGEPASYIVPGRALTQSLAQKAAAIAGVDWYQDAQVASVAVEPAYVSVGLVQGETLRARLVVAADGARSKVRDESGIKTLAWGSQQVAIVATVRLSRSLEGLAVQHFLSAGPFAILPLPDPYACITWSEDEGRAKEILALDAEAFATEINQRFGTRLGSIVEVKALASFPLDQHLARELVAPRVALIGEAARRVHPIAGQGLNLGFRDVAALTQVVIEAARLGQDVGSEATLAGYARWRRFDQTVSQLAFDSLNRLFSNDNPLLRGARDVGLSAVEQWPGLKRTLVREAAGLSGTVPRLLRGLPI